MFTLKAYLSDKGVGKDAVEILKKVESWSGGGGFGRLRSQGAAPGWLPEHRSCRRAGRGPCRGSAAVAPVLPGELVSEAVPRRTSLKLPRKVVFGRRSSRRRSARYNRDQPQA